MLKSYFKKVFGKDKEVAEAEQFYSPLRIGLHSTIAIETVDWITMNAQLNKSMVLPSSSFTINAIGETKTDDDSIYQIYVMDDNEQEFVLQLYCTDKGGKPSVVEATLFKQVVNIIPLTESEWDENMDAIGLNTLELDEQVYDRVWGSDQAGRMDLIEFNEKVVESNKTTSYTNNYLLYSRTFISLTDTEETEMLLVGVEETADTAEITMMVGLPVPLSNINVQ